MRIIRAALLILIALYGTGAAASEQVDSLLLVTQASLSTRSPGLAPGPVGENFPISRQTGLLESIITSRSFRLVQFANKPSRQSYFGVDNNGIIGFHLLMRGD